MKKIILTLVTAVALTVVSQAQMKVGVKAGGSVDNQNVDVSAGSIYSGKNVKGYHAGVVAELALGGNFYLQPQLLYSRKGAMHLGTAGKEDARVKLNYVEMPVNVLYKFDVGFGRVFAGAGGVFSYAISGKEVQNGEARKLYTNGGRNWHRKDISLSFTAGLELSNGLFASVNSQKGIWDIHKADNIEITNKTFSVSVGYMMDWRRLRKKA